MLAIFDTGPLYAALDRDNRDHERCAALLKRRDLSVVIPTLVVAEVSYLASTRLGAEVEAAFVQALADFDIEPPSPQDYKRIAELIRQYADFPLGTVDASVVALAERLRVATVATLDHRHFRPVRPRHCEALELLPA